MIPPTPGLKVEEPGYSARVRGTQKQNGHQCGVLTRPKGGDGRHRGGGVKMWKIFLMVSP